MKKWLTDRFLPMWAKETVLAENRRLEKENEELRQKLQGLECYLQGLRAGIRAGKRCSLNDRGGKE